jgi:hypothetical protein
LARFLPGRVSLDMDRLVALTILCLRHSGSGTSLTVHRIYFNLALGGLSGAILIRIGVWLIGERPEPAAPKGPRKFRVLFSPSRFLFFSAQKFSLLIFLIRSFHIRSLQAFEDAGPPNHPCRAAWTRWPWSMPDCQPFSYVRREHGVYLPG